jgi:HEAT repeat protein
LKAKKALTMVTNYAQHENEQIRKTALSALAAIADPSSATLLSDAAKRQQYGFDNANAFGAYLGYIENLNGEGNHALAEKLAKNLIKQSSKHEVQARIAALQLLVDIEGEKSLSTLAKASNDVNKVYRVAALKMGVPYMVASQSSFWLKQLKKGKPNAQAELITLLANKKMPLVLPLLKSQIKSANPQVKLAAITAAAEMGGTELLDDYLSILKNGDPEEVNAIKEALLTMKGDNINAKVAEAIPGLPKVSQAALLSVLGSRGATKESASVFQSLKDADVDVKQAAYQALTTTVGEKNIPDLFNLLHNTKDAKEALQIQDAINYALREIEGEDRQTEKVLTQMKQASVDQRPAYYGILGAIGGEKALAAVMDAYTTGNPANRAAAFQALAVWKQEDALPSIYAIAKETSNPADLNQALSGFVRLINSSSYPTDQKVIMLKDAMALSQTVPQKRSVLRALSAHKTFPALAFAGSFFEDGELAQQAANTVMEIALADPSIGGDLVKKHLNTTLEVLKGRDSEYLREAIRKHLSEMDNDKGFVQVFNGKDLTGWKGLVENPIARQKMDAKTLANKQKEANRIMFEGWTVKNGELLFLGKGDNLATIKDYGNIEMWVDWKIYDDGHKEGDAGIYLRGTPQVQIWDTSRVKVGAQVGSGGLYNNQVHESKPLVVADNPLGEWNAFYIKMIDDKVTVYLNGVLVTDNVILENYWDRNLPLFAKEQIELQAHGSRIGYRDIYIRELPSNEPYQLTSEEKNEGFEILFDGTSMDKWTGNTKDYMVENGEMVIRPNEGSGGNLFTKDEFSDFVFRFEFKLTPGANNGLGVRAPLEGDAAYEGIEIQILDNDAEIYKSLDPYQYHGSLYGIMMAKRGYLKPLGEWNYEEVQVKGDHFKVILNGTVILDGSIADAKANGTLDGKDHPGLFRKSGRIAFLGHGSEVYFKNIRVKRLD